MFASSCARSELRSPAPFVVTSPEPSFPGPPLAVSWVEDLGSANGTKVNGVRVRHQWVGATDEIRIGETRASGRRARSAAHGELQLTSRGP